MGAPEAKIEKYLLDECKKNDYMCLKFVSPSMAGVPDRLIIAKDPDTGKTLVCFVETKAPGEKPRKLQEAVIADMKEHGAVVFVADTQQLVDRIITWIRESLK